MIVTLKINNRPYEVNVRPDEFLVETLRNLRFFSVRKGCDTTSCGVCTILVDEKPVASCSYLTAKAQGHEITTIEGIKEEADKFVELMLHEGSDQCGYCSPGFTLTVYAMKKQLNNPNDDDIRNYLVGNLCRCSGYEGQQAAIRKYMEVE